MESKIERNRHYIYTYTLLTGGNPRLVLFLYELLLDNDHLDTDKILGKITELTPYFLDKTRDESSQRKMILDALVTGPPAQTATEISNYINAGQKSVTEQLKRLEAEGWIKQIPLTGEGVKKKEVFYTLRDYFYRVWYKVRMKGIDETDIYCMAELAAILFGHKELEERLTNHSQLAVEKKLFHQKALELAKDNRFMKNIWILIEESKNAEDEEILDLLKEGFEASEMKNWEKVIKYGKKLAIYPSAWKATGYYLIVIGYYGAGNYKECYAAFSDYIKHENEKHTLFNIFVFVPQLQKIVISIFNSAEELHRLLDKTSNLETKIESLCRLLLLGKLAAITEILDLVLKEKDLPAFETKKLEFFLRYCSYNDILENQYDKRESYIVMRYWTRLIHKINGESNIEKRLFEFVFIYILLTGNRNNSLTFIEDLMAQLYEEGIDSSGVIFKIIRAVKNQGTREAQQWMTDPLFAAIVKWFSFLSQPAHLSKKIRKGDTQQSKENKGDG